MLYKGWHVQCEAYVALYIGSEDVVYASQPPILPTVHTSVSPLSTAGAATIGIALSGTVIFVVVLLLVATFLLARKQSHSKQTAANLYETPDAITTKENKSYRANTQTQHIATAANEAYGHGGGIPVVQNVAYIPAAVNILPVQNEAYDHVSGAAVNTDTEEHIYVDITYDYYMN